MIHSKFIGVDEINRLKAQNKIRKTPDIIIFGGKRRRICKMYICKGLTNAIDTANRYKEFNL